MQVKRTPWVNFTKLFSQSEKLPAHCAWQKNGEATLLVHCLYQMSPLNHRRTTSSLAPPIFYVAKKSAIKRQKDPHCLSILSTIDSKRKLTMSPDVMLKFLQNFPNLCAICQTCVPFPKCRLPVNPSHLVPAKKPCTYLGETDPLCRFHQRFTPAFFVRIFSQSQNVTRKSRQNDVHSKNS